MAKDFQKRTSDQARALALRNLVAIFWAVLVGSLMAAGASFLDIPAWQIPTIALLGGAGAAVYVLYFA